MHVNSKIDRVSILRKALTEGSDLKYKRLSAQLEAMIREGHFAQGEKLPTHRRLADQLSVTAGTVSKAYSELHLNGLVNSHVGSGTYVGPIEHGKTFSNFENYEDFPRENFDLSRSSALTLKDNPVFRKTLEQMTLRQDVITQLSQYGPEQGYIEHRKAGANWISHLNFNASYDQVICTNGAQHALFCILLALLKRGDALLSESFTYPGLISACRSLGINIIGLAMDDEGILPSALDAACKKNKVSALYCMPTMQNPTTAVMSEGRRVAIAEICLKHNILILEDEAHAVLEKERPPPISFYAPERSIIISSLSKAVAAGIRAGFIHAPSTLVQRISRAVRSTCWMPTPIAMSVACHLIETNAIKSLLDLQISEISRRKNLVSPMFQHKNVKTHKNSPYYWIEVPHGWRASDIAEEAKQKNCLVSTAEAFAVDRHRTAPYLRASVSNPTVSEQGIVSGFKILLDVLNNPAT